MRLTLECVSIACPTCTIVDETPVQCCGALPSSVGLRTVRLSHVLRPMSRMASFKCHRIAIAPTGHQPCQIPIAGPPGSPTQPHHHHQHHLTNQPAPRPRPPVQPSHHCSNTASFSLFRGSCPPATSRCHPWLPPWQPHHPSWKCPVPTARSLRRSWVEVLSAPSLFLALQLTHKPLTDCPNRPLRPPHKPPHTGA